MAELKMDIVEDFGMLDENSDSNWIKHLALVSWNGGKPKFDIRPWDETMERCSKGITLTRKELEDLRDLIDEALADD